MVKQLKILHYDCPDLVTSRYRFYYESFATPALHRLREEYQLDKVIAGAKSDLEKFVALRDWVCRQWDHGWSFARQRPIIPPQNSLSILRAARKGVEFYCHYYATVLVQCALSLGFQARRLGIYRDISRYTLPQLARQTAISHSVTEIWSDDYGQWLLMDPDLNLHYERDHKPLSAYQVHQGLVEGWSSKISAVRGPHLPAFVAKKHKYTRWQLDDFKIYQKHMAIDFYRHLVFELANDWLSSRRYRGRVMWVDAATPPLLIESGAISTRGIHWTRNLQDVYWNLNQVAIHLEPVSSKDRIPSSRLHVRLETQTPNFDHYCVQIDDRPWRISSPNFVWNLHSGKNTLKARAANRFDREGPSSNVSVLFHEK